MSSPRMQDFDLEEQQVRLNESPTTQVLRAALNSQKLNRKNFVVVILCLILLTNFGSFGTSLSTLMKAKENLQHLVKEDSLIRSIASSLIKRTRKNATKVVAPVVVVTTTTTLVPHTTTTTTTTLATSTINMTAETPLTLIGENDVDAVSIDRFRNETSSAAATNLEPTTTTTP